MDVQKKKKGLKVLHLNNCQKSTSENEIKYHKLH